MVTNEGAASIRINTVRISLLITKICDFFKFCPERSGELRRARYIYAYIIIIVLLILSLSIYVHVCRPAPVLQLVHLIMRTR